MTTKTKMKYLTLIFVIIFNLKRNHCNLIYKPIVGIEMTTEGMHRDIKYYVQFDYPLASNDCEYILQQLIPAAAYVSTDQLGDLNRLNKLNAIYPKFVDIEVSTDKASPFNILLMGIPKINDNINLPIHFRYHPPNHRKKFITVEIPKPRMYMRCALSNKHFVDEQIQTSINKTFCLFENLRDLKEYFGDINEFDEDNADCLWKLINVDFESKTSLRAKIPIGDAKGYPPILYMTILISWVLSIWTVFRTNGVPRRINHKLEEQRLLQNKSK